MSDVWAVGEWQGTEAVWCLWELREVAWSERRTNPRLEWSGAGFDLDEAHDEVWDGICELPAVLPALRMRDQEHGLPNLLQQSRVGSRIGEESVGGVCLILHLACIECIEDLIALRACAGPLAVSARLRIRQGYRFLWRGEDIGGSFSRECYSLAVVRKPRRATSLGLIGKIDDVALTQEVGCPAFSAVRCVEPVRPALSGAVDEDHWAFVCYLVWDKAFNIDLAGHESTGGRVGCFAAGLSLGISGALIGVRVLVDLR